MSTIVEISIGTMVKGYEANVRIKLIPTPRLMKLTKDEQNDITNDAKGLKLTDFSVRNDGDVTLLDSYFAQYFFVEVEDEGGWEYDEGEVTTLKTVYSRQLHRR
jgi:hypothetical protein